MITKNKKGQLAIFIILALAIALVLILLFVGQGNLITLITGGSPIEQIKDCIQEPLEQAIDVVSLQGGSLNPSNYYLYEDKKVEYLCYTEDAYKKCFMQKPLLKQSIEKELETYIKPIAQECINNLKFSLQEKGYLVSSKPIEVKVRLIPNSILLDVKTDLNLEKENKEFYDSIRIDLSSRLYSFVMHSSSISNWEARYGQSETLIYMYYYPFLKVEKKKQSEGTTIYTLTDRNTLDKFRFATRSVAIPVGLGI
jgi:hypothetical protein